MSSRSPSLPTIARAASYRRRYGRLRTSSGRDGSVASAWRALRLRAAIVTSELALLVSACLLAACGGTAPVSAPAASPKAPPVEFRFPPTDTEVVSSETTRGRVTALAFITTYDMVSQLLVKRLGDVVVKFTPRINAAAVVMEPPVYAELLSIYREELALPFPVVMADFATQ